MSTTDSHRLAKGTLGWLRFERPNAEPLVFALKPGRNTVGRDPSNDVVIDDPTVSQPHCEIEVRPEGISLRDLGSTNGTFLDGEPIQTAVLMANQRVQIGAVVLVFEQDQPEPRAAAGSETHLERLDSETARAHSGCSAHPEKRAIWVCSDCGHWWCGACVKQVKLASIGVVTLCQSCNGLCERVENAINVARRPRSYGFGFIESLAYPFRGNALFVWVAATLLAGITGVLQIASIRSSHAHGLSSLFYLVNGIAGFGLMVTSAGFGAYLLAFFRAVLLGSAHGQASPPQWPSLDFEDLREVTLEFLAWGLVSFGPYTLWSTWHRVEPESTDLLGHGLLVLGIGYGAMALLAIVIYDSLSALNPLLVLLSMARAPVRYLILCGFLGGLVLVRVAINWGLARTGGPVLGIIFDGSFSVYGVLVALRALGWFYRSSESQLAWS